MATASVRRLSSQPDVIVVTWDLTTADATGDAVSFPEYADASWHFTGTNWGGATAAAQGSHTNTDGLFAAVSNANGGAAITATTDGAIKQQWELALFARPKLTTGGTAAVVRATAIFRKSR